MTGLFHGLLIVIAAAVMQGSFAVPMAYARTWKWENSWLVFSVFGMIVFNLLLAALSIPGLGAVYGAADTGDIVMPVVWGIVWGVGAVGFGLGITSAGLALGYAILLGTVLSMGTFIPMVVLHPADILTQRGIIVIAGLLVTITGISMTAYAGVRKEREQGASTGEITKSGRFSVKVGIIICFVAGLCSSVINIGFSLSRSLVDIALAKGAPDVWAGNVIWALMFSSGGVLNIAYCLSLMGKNKSAGRFVSPGSLRNLLLILFMSAMWIGSFILYGVGATMMGSWGTVIGWSVYMALSIALANAWGLFQGEWAGTTRETRTIMTAGLVVILAAIVVLAVGGMV